MRWPPDHPALTDEALAPWAPGADELCPDGEVVRVLRHLPGRRVTTLVRTGGALAVLKVFASPRGRGNIRRLRAFAATDAAPLVPRPLGADAGGHVALLEHVDGTPMPELPPGETRAAAVMAGAALRRLHACGAVLDRERTLADEFERLDRTSGAMTRDPVRRALANRHPAPRATVPSHRDCYPAQVVVRDGHARYIDLDDAAMAPAGLDVGNFVAHLRKDELVGRLPAGVGATAAEAFVAGYGQRPPDLDAWTALALARLAGLAETRHRDLAQAELLLLELAR